VVARATIRTLLISSFLVLANAGPAAPSGADSLVGQRAPEFALRDMEGKFVSITALRGKVVVLNFWATWCPPCKKEIPGLDALQRQYGRQGLAVVGVSTDSSERGIRDFLRENPAGYRFVHDRDGKVSRLYGVYSLPTTFVIDRSGIVIRHYRGDQDWGSREMRERLEALLERSSRDATVPQASPASFVREKEPF